MIGIIVIALFWTALDGNIWTRFVNLHCLNDFLLGATYLQYLPSDNIISDYPI